MWFLFVWLISFLWSNFFMEWCIDKGYSPIVLLVMVCPILNTIFAICRTYHAIKSKRKEKWKSFKDLFAE